MVNIEFLSDSDDCLAGSSPANHIKHIETVLMLVIRIKL